jgi:glycosyltransferase involved in cell wall biosynthesis
MSAVVLPGEKIAEDYHRHYGSSGRFQVVYNSWPTIGENRRRSPLRDVLGAKQLERIILYQGGIKVQRGLVKVVEAMPHLPPDAIFAILGYGPDGSTIQERARELGVADRVRILPAVPQRDLIAHTAGADIGIIPILNICRSYDLCSPLKLYEFIAAGLPLAVSNLAQLAWYVRSRALGEVFDPENPREIAHALRHLLEDEAYRAQCAEHSRKTQLCEASWDIQSEKLRKLILET